MKKFIAALVTLTLLFCSLTGCGQQTGDTAPSTGNTTAGEAGTNGGDRKIVILGSARLNPGEEEAWNEVKKGFEAENPGYILEIKWQGKWDEVVQNLAAAKLANEQVDLFQVGAGIIRQTFAPGGLVMDMTDLLEPYKDRFAPDMFGGVTIGDRIWGIPLGSSGSSTFFYNKTMFDELGLTEPKTFDELVSVSDVIREKKNIMPMIHHGKVTSFWPMLFMETYAQTSGNKSIENVKEFLSGNRSFQGPEEAEAFALVKKFFDAGILNADSFNTDTDGMRAVFTQQKAAMFYGGTWEYAPVKDAVTDFEIGIFPFPLMVDKPGVKVQPGGGGGAGGLVMPSFARQDNLDATMRFVEYLLRPENAQKVIVPTEPIIPTIKGVQIEQDAILKELNDEYAAMSIVFLDWIWPAEINDSFKQAIPAVASSNMTPEAATEVVQKRLETIIKEKDYKFDWWSTWTEEDWAKVTPQSIPPSYAK